MEEPIIKIIVLNWNGKKDTLECLSSLEALSSKPEEIIVVDNGSQDGSQEAIRQQFPSVTLIETGQNLGFAEGNNVGIRYALSKKCDYIFLLNNDTVVDPDILKSFTLAMKEYPQVGILGANIYLFEERNKFDHLGGKWNQKKGSFDLIGLRQLDDGKQWQAAQELDYACGCALFIRREVFEAIGLLESRFFLIWEESDFCFRARRVGFLTMSCPQAKLWHKVSASFVGGKPHSTYFWWRNRLFWIERNCSLTEKISLYLRVLLPDIAHLYKLRILKTAQLYLLRLLKPKQSHKKRHERILKYRAALEGIKDYSLRRFGNGPNWIYTTKPQD